MCCLLATTCAQPGRSSTTTAHESCRAGGTPHTARALRASCLALRRRVQRGSSALLLSKARILAVPCRIASEQPGCPTSNTVWQIRANPFAQNPKLPCMCWSAAPCQLGHVLRAFPGMRLRLPQIRLKGRQLGLRRRQRRLCRLHLTLQTPETHNQRPGCRRLWSAGGSLSCLGSSDRLRQLCNLPQPLHKSADTRAGCSH